MCVCVPVSLFGFSELSSSALYFISFLFDYDLSFVCVAVGDAIDESGIKVALGFLWTEMTCRLYYTIWGKTE